VLTQTRIARSENCNKSGARVAWLLAGLQDDCCGARNLEPSAGRCRGSRRGRRWRLQRNLAACGFSDGGARCAGCVLGAGACAELALLGVWWAEGWSAVLLVRPNLHKFAAEISVAVNVGEGDCWGRRCCPWLREAVVEQTDVWP
jgi:hypothetical protein